VSECLGASSMFQQVWKSELLASQSAGGLGAASVAVRWNCRLAYASGARIWSESVRYNTRVLVTVEEREERGGLANNFSEVL
jgi:L-aminopeptidase/D-esterase-like protein